MVLAKRLIELMIFKFDDDDALLNIYMFQLYNIVAKNARTNKS